MALDNVHPIPDLRPANQRQDLVGCQIERVQRQPEIGMLDEREKAEGAVLHPLQNHPIREHPHLGFHKGRKPAQRPHVVARAHQGLAVCLP